VRSLAETGKDGPLAHTAAAALLVGVVLRHQAAAACCLCLSYYGCGCGSGILHVGGRSPD